MSIGPNIGQEPEISRWNKINYDVKKAVEKYFQEPVKYIFYGTLSITILGLFFGMNFPWQYWLILGALFLAEFYKFAYPKDKEEKDHGTE